MVLSHSEIQRARSRHPGIQTVLQQCRQNTDQDVQRLASALKIADKRVSAGKRKNKSLKRMLKHNNEKLEVHQRHCLMVNKKTKEDTEHPQRKV